MSRAVDVAGGVVVVGWVGVVVILGFWWVVCGLRLYVRPCQAWMQRRDLVLVFSMRRVFAGEMLVGSSSERPSGEIGRAHV